MPYKNRICVICGKEYTPTTSRQKACSKECSAVLKHNYRMEWYKNNPDYNKNYREANIDRIRQNDLEYHQKTKDARKKHREEHREEYKKRDAEYYQKNKERYKKRWKVYYKEHKTELAQKDRERRAQHKERTGESIDKTRRKKKLEMLSQQYPNVSTRVIKKLIHLHAEVLLTENVYSVEMLNVLPYEALEVLAQKYRFEEKANGRV